MANATEWPTTLAAGNTVKATRTHAAYPASDGWALDFYLTGVSVLGAVAGTPNGDAFDFTLTPTQTKKLSAGTYTWTERASKSGEVYDVASGTLAVTADIAALGAGDGESFEEKALRLVEARLLARYSEDMETFQIGTRTVAQIPHDELLAVRDDLKERVRLANASGGFLRDVRVSFTGTVNET